MALSSFVDFLFFQKMYFKGRLTEQVGEGEILHLLVDSPDGHSSQGLPKEKPGAGTASGPPLYLQRPEYFNHLWLLSQVNHQGARSEVEHVGFKPVPIWDVSTASEFHLLC